MRKTLWSRVTKDKIEDLRKRVAISYSAGHISRGRMEVLMGDLDKFELHAMMPKHLLTKEAIDAEFHLAPPVTLRLGKVNRLRLGSDDTDMRWVNQHYSAPLTSRPSVVYGRGRQVRQ
jgi:hypothetical protein